MSKGSPPWACAGFVGWILGHRFPQYINRETCLRCGMPAGGWKK